MNLLAVLPFLIPICASALFQTEDLVKFILFTRAQPDSGVPITRQNIKPLEGAFRLVFLVHGWTQDRHANYYEELKNAYLTRPDERISVVQTDWSFASRYYYSTSSVEGLAVGEILGDLITIVSKQLGIPFSRIEIVGHSLGAHIAGIAGQYVYANTNSKIGKITALDPAGPIFEILSPEERLSPDDAIMVIVFHTDRGVLGFFGPCGTIDFYPNNGVRSQPGCSILETGCSHYISHVFFTEAIQTGVFYGRRCGSFTEYLSGACTNNLRVNFGQHIPENITGSFFAITNYNPPYHVTNT